MVTGWLLSQTSGIEMACKQILGSQVYSDCLIRELKWTYDYDDTKLTKAMQSSTMEIGTVEDEY